MARHQYRVPPPSPLNAVPALIWELSFHLRRAHMLGIVPMLLELDNWTLVGC